MSNAPAASLGSGFGRRTLRQVMGERVQAAEQDQEEEEEEEEDRDERVAEHDADDDGGDVDGRRAAVATAATAPGCLLIATSAASRSVAAPGGPAFPC